MGRKYWVVLLGFMNFFWIAGHVEAAPGGKPAACGKPKYDYKTDQGIFLWKSCSTGEWQLRVNAGGSASVQKYEGEIKSDQPFAGVKGNSVEASDVVDTSDPLNIDFYFRTVGKGVDGLDFSTTADAYTCIDVVSSAGLNTIYVGPERKTVIAPFDLNTLSSCANPEVPVEPPITAFVGPSLPYLQDMVLPSSLNSASQASVLDKHLWPRILLTETKTLTGTNEQYSKYNIIGGQAGSFRRMENIQKAYPEVTMLRHFPPIDFQGWHRPEYCHQGSGVPFEETTSYTGEGGCGVFAGHWLYHTGTAMTGNINSTTKTLQVKDASRVQVGKYAVIYDAPAGSFKNAEHVKVVARNTNVSPNTLTVAARGYKSKPRAHSQGAIVAQHAEGECHDSRCWAYNHGLHAPRDANSKTISEYMAGWLKDNFYKDERGDTRNIKFSGILFDVDSYYKWDTSNLDINNDLEKDGGISSTGEMWWGAGLEAFYGLVRQRFPNMIIEAGARNSLGLASTNGIQVEGWPVSGGFYSPNPEYKLIDELLNKYFFSLRNHQSGPMFTHNLSKTPSHTYGKEKGVANNRSTRFALGTTLLGDGYFGEENSREFPDKWYDEYAVNTTKGSLTYGYAISSDPDDESSVRTHVGWLGRPLGAAARIYDEAAFATGNSLVPNGLFDSDLFGWSGNKVKLTRDSSDTMDSGAALHASRQTTYDKRVYGARINGPRVSLTGGVQYTFAFAAKASAVRQIKAAVGSQGQRFLLEPQWRRYVMTLTAPTTGEYRIGFNVGRENTEIWLDSVYLFEGNANVFRRDFDHGIVVINATPSIRTVDLQETFQRIRGTQDVINDGTVLNSVTLQPYDAAILVRPDELQ